MPDIIVLVMFQRFCYYYDDKKDVKKVKFGIFLFFHGKLDEQLIREKKKVGLARLVTLYVRL